MINTKHIACDGIRSYFPYMQVYEAITKVNELFGTEAFYQQLAELPDFDMADVSPVTIAALIKKARLDMSLDLYYALNPLKNIDGYDDIRTPSVIHMNLWRIDRPVPSLCNTLVHATVHAVNAFYDRFYFGHGDLPGVAKHNTAPYRIGALAEYMISGEEQPYNLMEHDSFEAPKKAMKDMSVLSFGAVA
jgi:hypothetical protein